MIFFLNKSHTLELARMTDFHTLISDRFGFAALQTSPADDAVDKAASVLGRRTLRRYTNDPVDPAHLDMLLACAQSAPAKSDLQQYSVVVVEDAAKREKIGDWLSSMAWVKTAPALLIFCGDMRRNRRICEMRGYKHANDNVDTFMNAAVDAGLALGFFMSAAERTGLGCCPLSMVRNHVEALSELLGLPDGVFPVAGLTVGWPSDQSRSSLRLPPQAVVHRDSYDDAALESYVDQYDQLRLERQPIPPEKQRHVDRYGALDNARWSENIARQLSLPERDGFRQWLKGVGINLD